MKILCLFINEKRKIAKKVYSVKLIQKDIQQFAVCLLFIYG